MGLIKITKDDLLRSKPPEDGWHLFKVSEVEEKKSRKGDSVNTNFHCLVDDPADSSHGRERIHTINSKGNQAYNLDFLCAVLNMGESELFESYSNAEGELELNTDGLAGKRFYGEVQPDSYEDASGKTKVTSKILAFQPESDPPF